MPLVIIAGADGCKGGWAVICESADGRISWEVVPTVRALLDSSNPPELLALDIPIGLMSSGSRECDTAARQLLGQPRGRSVFTAPIRPMLAASSYSDACAIGRQIEGRALSKQAWAILPKIREVDALLRGDASLRDRVHEVHPELCFFHLAGGQPVVAKKRSPEGQARRAGLLRMEFGTDIDAALGARRDLRCEADDILDAFVALWTARRIRFGTAKCLPEVPPRDECGLPMEMLA